MALTLHDANGIAYGTTAFHRSRWWKWSKMTFLVIWNHWHQWKHCQWNHYITSAQTIELRYNMTLLLMWWHWCHCQCHTINGTIAFLQSTWPNWGATWLFGHVMPLASASHGSHGIVMAHDTIDSTSSTTGTKSQIIPLKTSQHKKCNGVIDGTISIMPQEACDCHVQDKN